MPLFRPRRLRLVPAILVSIIATLVPTRPATAQFGFDTLEPADGDKIVSMEVVTADGTIIPGATEYIGVRLQIQRGWHIYWSNPGDSGAQPRIRIKAPEGVTVGEIAWPRPVIFESHDETTYGYSDDVTLLVPITASETIAASNLELPVEVEWLVCKRACLMGDATATVSLKVWPRDDNSLRARGNRLADAIRRLPTPIAKVPDMAATIIDRRSDDGTRTKALVVTGTAGHATAIRFIPDLTPGVTAGDGRPVKATLEDGRFRIEVPLRVEPDNALDRPLEAAGLVLFGPNPQDRSVSFRIPVTG
jgi:DsbC/DsbD-like thiol-disulfide interchange protein